MVALLTRNDNRTSHPRNGAEFAAFKRDNRRYTVRSARPDEAGATTVRGGATRRAIRTMNLDRRSGLSRVFGGLTLGLSLGIGLRWGGGTRLYNVRRRWYDAGLQRFVSRDPLSGSNRYAYANGNPVAFVDPTGLAAFYIYNVVLPNGKVVMVGNQTGADYIVAELSRLSGYSLTRDPNTGLVTWNPNVLSVVPSPTVRALLDAIRSTKVSGQNRYSIYLTQNRNCGNYMGNFSHEFDPRFMAWGNSIQSGIGDSWLAHEVGEGWTGSLGGLAYGPAHRPTITNYDNAVLTDLHTGLVRLPDVPGSSAIHYNKFNVDFSSIPPVRR